MCAPGRCRGSKQRGPRDGIVARLCCVTPALLPIASLHPLLQATRNDVNDRNCDAPPDFRAALNQEHSARLSLIAAVLYDVCPDRRRVNSTVLRWVRLQMQLQSIHHDQIHSSHLGGFRRLVQRPLLALALPQRQIPSVRIAATAVRRRGIIHEGMIVQQQDPHVGSVAALLIEIRLDVLPLR